jgi:predicted nucleic acid-binding protein
MKVVVADTSPLNYLVLLGKIELLPQLFANVWIPTSVRLELTSADSPPAVCQWASAIPGWIVIEDALEPIRHIYLDQGEANAISLALESEIPTILMDDRMGRERAVSLGLRTLGLLAILAMAHEKGLLDYYAATQALKSTSFRASQAIIDEVGARLHSGPSQ